MRPKTSQSPSHHAVELEYVPIFAPRSCHASKDKRVSKLALVSVDRTPRAGSRNGGRGSLAASARAGLDDDRPRTSFFWLDLMTSAVARRARPVGMAGTVRR